MSLLPLLPSPPLPPLLSAPTSVLASSLFTLSYVGGLYLSTSTRVGSATARDELGRALDKDHPRVVRNRLKVVGWSTVASCAGVGILLGRKGAFNGQEPLFQLLSWLRLLGIPLPTPSLLSSSLFPTTPPLHIFLSALARVALLPLTLTATLYTGPLYAAWLEEELPGQKGFEYARDVRAKWDNVWGVRNYIVGPLTEEVVFRACILSVTYYAGASKAVMVFATPLYFGVAHLHHAWEVYVKNGRTRAALKRGLIQAAAQFTYTCGFGWYANFLFMRTGTVLAPFISHVFCNIMGLPNPGLAIEYHPKRKRSIQIAHLAGILGFGSLLYRITRPALFGGSVYWQS